jgi:hypothetical protein
MMPTSRIQEVPLLITLMSLRTRGLTRTTTTAAAAATTIHPRPTACWSAYLLLFLVAAYASAATPGMVSAPSLTCRLVPGQTTPTSSIHVLPSLCTLVCPRRWSTARPLQILHLGGSIVAWISGNRRSSLHSASRMLSVRHPLPPAPAVQAVQRLLGECACQEIGPVGLSDSFHELAVTWPRTGGAVAPPLRERHGARDSHA